MRDAYESLHMLAMPSSLAPYRPDAGSCIRAISTMASAYVCWAGRWRIAEVVEMLAIRKDHSELPSGAKRGDLFQIILIQVTGGYAAKPTAEDGTRERLCESGGKWKT